MTKEEIKILADKILLGTATEEEILQYNRICNFAESTGRVSELITEEEKDELKATMKEAIFIKAGIHKDKVVETGKVYRMAWLKWAAAAAILVLLGIGYIYFRSPESQKLEADVQQQTQPLKNDVAPGHEGAVLTLADGQTIVLDSAKNGTLTIQGSAQVVKKDGQIVYDIDGKTNEVVYNTMTTPKGRQYHLTLADGTGVWLNAGSSITYPTAFVGKQRLVQITGEVYFEVAHNKEMPFLVEKGNVRVEVLGTHFNINAYDDERFLKVTLLEGAVRVSAANAENVMMPGQQADIMKENITIQNKVNIEEVMAWKKGIFYFSGLHIEEIMRQLSRWYNVDFVYNNKVDDLFYAKISRNTKLSDVLRALELTGKVQFNIEGNKIIVMP